MLIETVPLSTLHADPVNARLHSRRNLEVICSSLKRFGQQKPIVVDAAGIVRAGNGTLAAAKSLGWSEINIVRTPLRGSEAAAYAIADNRAGEFATWDDAILTSALADAQIGDVGFTDKELRDLLDIEDIPIAEAAEAVEIDESFQVIVDCRDEQTQKRVFDQMTSEGHPCRLLTL